MSWSIADSIVYNDPSLLLQEIGIMPFLVFFVLLCLVMCFYVFVLYKIYIKAGKKWREVLVPIYNWYTFFSVAWRGRYYWVVLLCYIVWFSMSLLYFATVAGMQTPPFIALYGTEISMVCSILMIVLYAIAIYKLSKRFWHGGWFAVWLFFLPAIFYPILAFGWSTYHDVSVWNTA